MNAVEILAALEDHEFPEVWTNLSDGEKAALDPADRKHFVARFNELHSWSHKPGKKLNGKHSILACGSLEERAAAMLESGASTWPEALDLAALATREPEKPSSIMQGLPCGYAIGVSGHGGVGKSAIVLHLAVCVALGIPFFGMPVEQRRTLYLSCEDREGVLHWRLSRICKYLGIDLADLDSKLDIIDLVGRDVVLWEKDPRTGYTHTAAFSRLAERVQQCHTELLVVDGISDTFAGNENSRSDVKRFINALVSLVPPDRGATLLIGHVNKVTASNSATSEGYSGSTAWHNSMRARWYLRPETVRGEESDGPQNPGELILELQKSNLGRSDLEMRFAWDNEAHLFVGKVAGATHFDRKLQERDERDGILAALKSCITANPPVVVPAAMQGQRTAYHVISLRPDFPKSLRGKPAARRFRRQIEELRQLHLIVEREYRRSNRHVGIELILTEEGMRQCAK